MFFLPGVSGFLFAPMAMAVVFALIGSFILSRTLVNTLASYLLVAHGDSKDADVARSHDASKGHHPKNPLVLFQHRLRKAVREDPRCLSRLSHPRDGAPRAGSPPAFWLSCCSHSLLVPFLGENFFPAVDAGAISLHVRAPDRHAHRGNRGAVRSYRKSHPPGDPARPAGFDRRQYRPAGQRHQHAPISIPAAWGRRMATS